MSSNNDIKQFCVFKSDVPTLQPIQFSISLLAQDHHDFTFGFSVAIHENRI